MDEADVIERLGRSLYGRDWPARLAEDMGVSRSHVYALHAGRRVWTDDVKARLRAVLADAPARLANDHADRLVAVREALAAINERWGQ